MGVWGENLGCNVTVFCRYISEWETVGFGGPGAPPAVTSNIRVTTKVAVHALLSKELRDVGSALVYNMVAKEVKTAVSS